MTIRTLRANLFARTLAVLMAFTPIAARANATAARPAVLPVGACINLGNHMDSPRGEAVEHRLGDADFARLRAAGFVTVRLTVNWSGHSAATPPHTIDPAWLARVRAVVGGANAAGLRVILDSHNFEPVHSDPAVGAPWLAAVWRQIGAAFARVGDDQLWFEIENEPHQALTNANLGATFDPALAAIRKSNPRRIVIWGGENWSGIDSLASLPLPADRHVWPTFHYYEPFDFTHQGANWVHPSPPLGRAYGTPADAARLTADVAKVRAFAARTGRVPLMGETGAFETVPLDQRIAYTRAVHDAFAPLGVGQCQWAYTLTFPFFDRQTGHWVPGMRGAIGLSEAD